MMNNATIVEGRDNIRAALRASMYIPQNHSGMSPTEKFELAKSLERQYSVSLDYTYDLLRYGGLIMRINYMLPGGKYMNYEGYKVCGFVTDYERETVEVHLSSSDSRYSRTEHVLDLDNIKYLWIN